mgnify:CR=1 FL=1
MPTKDEILDAIANMTVLELKELKEAVTEELLPNCLLYTSPSPRDS